MKKFITILLAFVVGFAMSEIVELDGVKYDNLDVKVTEDFLPLFDESHPAYYCRNMAWYGGRGAAKSWQVARGLLLRCAKEQALTLCAREFQASIADSVLKLLEEQIYLLDLQDIYNVQRNYIECVNGSAFIFKGLRRNINSIKSIEGVKYCWVEEAQTVSKESWDILVPTIRMEGSQIFATFNPYLETDPTYQRYIGSDEKPPIDDLYCRLVNYDSNPFFPEVLRKEMEWDKAHDYEKYLHVWEGKAIEHLESIVFKNWRIDGHISPPDDAIIRQGADFGFKDPSCMLRAWVDDHKRCIFVDYEAYGVEVEIDNLPDLFTKIPNAKKWLITADSSRPETISFMRHRGFKIKGTKKGKNSVEEGVEFLKSYTIVVHPRCQHLIAELGLYKYKTDPKTDEVLPILEDKHNHCIDALRYALEALKFKRTAIHI